jgi:hypothetical protein
MTKKDKELAKILSVDSDTNINFYKLCNVLHKLGFQERIRGDHYIFTKEGVEEIINIQPIGSVAKPYQVKQVRQIILKYKLGGEKYALL